MANNPKIKIYKEVNPEEHSISFDLKRMEAIFDKMGGKVDEPHRHAYFTIIFIEKADGVHIIDFNEFELSSNQVYFISPGQVHQLKEKSKSKGWVLSFSPSFLFQNGIEERFIEDVHLFQDYGYSPPLNLNKKEFEKAGKLLAEIRNELDSNNKFKYHAVGALLKLLLIEFNNNCDLNKEENTQKAQAAVQLLKSFKQLLSNNYKKWHKVNQYAEALNISADYLNASVKELSGIGAKELIQSQIVLQAKRLLLFSTLSNKEIAYELGFSEPSNFSQFFKKCTGKSPQLFKKSNS